MKAKIGDVFFLRKSVFDGFSGMVGNRMTTPTKNEIINLPNVNKIILCWCPGYKQPLVSKCLRYLC